MANNWEKSFTIEYDNTIRKTVNCRDCIHADSDGSCNKKGYVFSIDGKTFWKKCTEFELNMSSPNSKEKLKNALKYRKKVAIATNTGTVYKTMEDIVPKNKINIKKVESPTPINNMAETKNHSSQPNKSTFSSLSSDTKRMFAKALTGDRYSKSLLCSLVPADLQIAFYEWLDTGNDDLLQRKTLAWLWAFGIKNVSRADFDAISKNVFSPMSSYIEKRYGKRNYRVKKMDFSDYFINFFAKYLANVNALEGFM